MNDYLKDIVREVTSKHLSEVLIDPPKDLQKMSDSKRESWKRQAKRILESELFQYAFKCVANDAAKKIIREHDSDLLRGKILGIGELYSFIGQWMAEVSNHEEGSYTEDAKAILKAKQDEGI